MGDLSVPATSSCVTAGGTNEIALAGAVRYSENEHGSRRGPRDGGDKVAVDGVNTGHAEAAGHSGQL